MKKRNEMILVFLAIKQPARHLKRRVFLSTVNSIIAGMVAVAGGAVAYNPWSAVVVGFIAALSFLLWSKLLLKLHIDDPVETAAGKIEKKVVYFSLFLLFCFS
jgi:ammonia channel protein AmtB